MSQSFRFEGFQKQSLTFLRSLAAHNNKVWFEDHRNDYNRFILEPAQRFVGDFGSRLQKLSPDIIADPRIDRSIFRLYRDTRFSKDKTPFKTHLGIVCWTGSGSRTESPCFYFHLEPGRLLLCAGIHTFPGEMLSVYRNAVADKKSGPALSRIVQKIETAGPYTFFGEHYKRVPRGFDPDHPRAQLLKFSGFGACCSTKVPAALFSKSLLDNCERHARAMWPINRWLEKYIIGPSNQV